MIFINMSMNKTASWYSNPLLYFHIATHLSIIPMILYANTFEFFISIFMYYMFGCWGVAITYHRLISHKSFVAPAWFKYIGLVFGSLGGVGSIIQWTAVHRDHHKHADTDKDPHNPAGGIKRFLQMQFFPMLVSSHPKFVPDLLRDRTYQKFHIYYWYIHLLYVLILLLIDPLSIIYAYMFPCLILWHVMSALGTFAHTPIFGKNHPKSDNDNSTNLWILGWLAFGEGWHNNHHAEASNFRFGRKKYQFDLSAHVIELVKINS